MRYAYVAGAMGNGIASEEWVIRLARAGILGYFGAGGLPTSRTASAIRRIRAAIVPGQPFGINFLHNPVLPAVEDELIDLLLAERVHRIEASAFIRATPALVRYRLTGLRQRPDGGVEIANKVMAKVSRPEVARQFFTPADATLVEALRRAGAVTDEEARLARLVPLADDVCAEADSGGHTDRRVAYTLVPHFRRMRDEIAAETGLPQRVRIGSAGGIGTPDAAAAAFMLGADFVMTGSINQCTPEAGISDTAKDMLAQADLPDFDIAPAGDMFEIGAKVQVLKRGSLFASRANRLYDLYRTCSDLDAIPAETLREIEERYLGRSIDAVWQETSGFYAGRAPGELAEARSQATQEDGDGVPLVLHPLRPAGDRRPLRPARQFPDPFRPRDGRGQPLAPGTPLEDWRRRNVDVLADRLMAETARLFDERLSAALRRSEREAGAASASALRRGFRGCDQDVVRRRERIVGMAHRPADHRMEAAGLLGIGQQLVHELHVRDRHVLGDRAQAAAGEADRAQDLLVARHAIDVGARRLRGPALERPFQPAGVELARLLDRDQVDHRDAAAGPQHPERLAQEGLARVEVEGGLERDHLVDAARLERQLGRRAHMVLDPRIGVVLAGMLDLQRRHVDAVDARRIAGLRHADILVAEAAAGIDDDVARRDAGQFGQQVDHRFRRLRDIRSCRASSRD